ncbi:PhnB protein [Paenibacillus sp. UNC496MF]|uniref:VOC family protein n=1 Tax=Paenibacillus sp. UNC496MF TaxID=1502753 RepID=UPI0008EE9207|nr:VOC family protein [Paenibacillus sp. UNC496MF]SFJ23878.1 PhnB protein [Paenibacillus sp. UNC496MF]
MAKITPYLYSANAREQAGFYARALDGEIVSLQTFADMPGNRPEDRDRVMHLVLQAAGVTFFLADAGPVERGNGLDLTLEFETEDAARQAFDRLAEGGRVLMPFERMFWGSLFGRLTDPFGVRWQIATAPGGQ